MTAMMAAMCTSVVSRTLLPTRRAPAPGPATRRSGRGPAPPACYRCCQFRARRFAVGTSAHTRSRVRPRLAAALVAAIVVLAPAAAVAEQIVKIATLAPEGSTWMTVLRAYQAAVEEASGDRLQFRIFPGGVSGSEADMLRKLRFGQLDAVALTGAGLGLVVPEERVLDGALLFRDDAEIDAVYRQFTPELEQLFEERGYVVLGWAEVGPIYLFSTSPVASMEELRRLRWWMLEGDPLAAAIFAAFGADPVPLHVADVLTALQTGVVDGVYSSPLALLALQWFSRVDYRLDLPLGHASGALLMNRRTFSRLAADLQELLIDYGRRFMAELQQRSRADNEAALAALARRGVQPVAPGPGAADLLRAQGAVARRSLVPDLYPETLLDRVEDALAAHRSGTTS